jgi:hypothetical protein
MKGKQAKRNTHIIRRNCRNMGLQRNVGFFGLLRAFEVSGLSLRNLLYRGPGSPRSNIWLSWLIRGRRRSSRSICRWLFIITA